MIAGKTEIRYEVLYEDSLPLFHRLLVLGVDRLDVLPHQALGVLEVLAALTEDVCRMEGRHRLDPAFEVVPLATVLGDPEVFIYDGLGGGTAEAEDDLRLYRLYLALQVGVAGLDLTRPRLAVLEPPSLLDRRPALDYVGQIDVLTGEINRSQDVVEELARPPDEGQPGGVLVLARSLADEHQRRVRLSGTEDRVGAAEGQVALGADRHLPGELRQTLFPALAAFRSVKKTFHSSSAGYLWQRFTLWYSTLTPPAPARER